MNAKLLAAASSLLLAVSARADLVAGWDASQYFDDGLLSTDGATAASTLDANYSDLDPNGAGSEAAAFGKLYYDGSRGSDGFTIDFSGTEPFVPSATSLTSNADATPLIFGSAGAFGILMAEGQTFRNDIKFLANSAVSVVFQADLSSRKESGTGWGISYAGQTLSGESAVGLEYSTDGINYNPLVDEVFNTTDTRYTASLGGADGAQGVFVRFNFDPTGSDLPSLDNVAITVESRAVVPEPGTAALLGLGLAGLVGFGRRCT
jgi:hypothetical protein